MLIKLIPQRFFRVVPVLVAAFLLIFLLTAARLRHGPLLPGLSATETPPKEPPKSPPKKVGSTEPEGRPIHRPKLAPGACTPEIEFLRRPQLGLSDNIVYSRRCVKAAPEPHHDRYSVANISRPLITHTTSVDLASCSHAEFIPCDHLTLQVPSAYPQKTYDHIVFGVASNYNRLNDSLAPFAHWLAGTSAHLVGVVSDAEDPTQSFDLSALEDAYKARGISATFLAPIVKKKKPEDPEIAVEIHHFMLIRNLLNATTAKTKWIGILDDDTFFPSLYPLDEQLETYDHTKSLWLGALSDSFGSVKAWGYMAFGGAGVFISQPLAKELDPHLEDCISEASTITGDGLLRDCIYTRTRTKLTLVPGLYQHDTHGDMSGFFESGVRPLSVHHWKSWYKVPMPQMAAITRLCGDCFLARHRFSEDTLLANGYSITHYPDGLDKIDLDKMEGTWRNPARPDFDFSFPPLRNRLSPAQKKSYRLADVEVTAKGAFRQIYVYRGNVEKDEPDEVVELLWENE